MSSEQVLLRFKSDVYEKLLLAAEQENLTVNKWIRKLVEQELNPKAPISRKELLFLDCLAEISTDLKRLTNKAFEEKNMADREGYVKRFVNDLRK